MAEIMATGFSRQETDFTDAPRVTRRGQELQEGSKPWLLRQSKRGVADRAAT